MNHDNIVSKSSAHFPPGVCLEKTNNPYTMMIIHFNNGYRLRVLVNDDQKFGIKDALQTQSIKSDDKLDLID